MRTRDRRPARGLEDFETRGQRGPARSTLVLLVLACASIITLDYRGGADSPIEPARSAVGSVFGPVEEATTAAVKPFTAIPQWFHGQDSLRHDVAVLEAENSRLRQQVETTALDRQRLAEYDGLARAATDTGYSLVPAHVIGFGPAQSFGHTVTIDAGTASGITADMTVVNRDGLVGRVVRATAHSATVLLIIDSESTVGGRVGSGLQVGFLHGRGQLGDGGDLVLELVDSSVVTVRDDVVVTWGSEGGVPYVAGIPIGRVVAVSSSPRETSQNAVIEPFVDFGALDLVGVVVPAGTRSDRSLVEAAR